MMREALLAAAACALLAGCPGKPEGGAAADPPRYEVLKGGRVVLTMQDKPGAVVSAGAPPPDGKPVAHPWLSAASRDAASEDELRGLLEVSQGFDDFVARLKSAGYEVRRQAR